MSLTDLHNRIQACRKCFEFSQQIVKPVAMDRGQGSQILVIGVAPGKEEIERERAFSGRGGRVLFQWLRKAGIGNSEQEIRKGVYFTSIIKCVSPSELAYRRMARNCVKFLYEQIRSIRPKVIVTLGDKPLRVFAGDNHTLAGVVGRSFRERDLHGSLFTITEDETRIVPFPHPSPRSRWTSRAENKELLKRAIEELSILAWGKR